MKRRRVTLFALTLALGLSSYFTEAVAEQTLGRLFYTPDQRVAMERIVTEENHSDNSTATSFDGQIRRSDGKTVNWVNGSLADSPEKAQSLLQNRLKVGQSVETQTGEVHDRLKGGRIVVRDTP